MSKLDDIYNGLYLQESTDTDDMLEFKRQIKALILELIGEELDYEKYPRETDMVAARNWEIKRMRKQVQAL